MWDVAGSSVEASTSGGPSAARRARSLEMQLQTGVEQAEASISAFLQARLGPKEGLVKQVEYDSGKLRAVIEFCSPVEATRGLGLDGQAMLGQVVRLRRMEGGGGLAMPLQASIADGPEKLFVGGVPPHCTDRQLIELASRHGALKGFSLVRDQQGLCKGFGFLEYLDPAVTDEACRRLTGLRLGDKTLLVQRAQKGRHEAPPLPSGPQRLTSVTSHNLLALQLPVAASLEAMKDKGQAYLSPTPVLVLLNAVSLDDVKDERRHRELVDDMQSECQRYGKLLDVLVPSPRDTPAKGVGRVFLHYASKDDAERAQKALAFRRFNNRCLLTCYFPESLWAAKELSGDPSLRNEADAPPEVSYNNAPPPRRF